MPPPPIEAAAAFGIAYRPEREQDAPFLTELYASTRVQEFAPLGWPAETLAAFLEQQRRAQDGHYRALYPAAERLIVEADGAPIGRLYLDSRPASVHLIDISLLPARRGHGLGTAILIDLIAGAEGSELAVSLHVEQLNPARRLYQRLGFRTTADSGPYHWMERSPEPR